VEKIRDGMEGKNNNKNPVCVHSSCVGFSREAEPIGCVYTHRKRYMELCFMIPEAGKSKICRMDHRLETQESLYSCSGLKADCCRTKKSQCCR